MLRFLMEAGPVIFPLFLLGVVIVILTLYNTVIMLAGVGTPTGARRRRSIDSVLFWGGVAAVLGFLGQWLGVNKLVHVVVEKGIINPQLVVYGLSESLLTPVTGVFILVGAGCLWFCLRLGLWTLERR